MNFELFGLEQDLKIEKENVEKFYNEYKELNQLITQSENKYDDLLLNYGTEDFKIFIGLMANALRNIDLKGYKVINSIYDAIRNSVELEFGIFLGNRILEKYPSKNSTEGYLIRLYTLKNVLDILAMLKDKYYFVKYLDMYIKEFLEFMNNYPYSVEEHYNLGANFYSYMYVFSNILEKEDKGLGYLIKLYRLRKSMIEKSLITYPIDNNLIIIFNIISTYYLIEDDVYKLSIDIDDFYRDFIEELRDIKIFTDKNIHLRDKILSKSIKNFISEFTTILFSEGKEEYYKEIIDLFPSILNRENQIMIDLYKLEKSDIENKNEELEKIRERIERIFNNTPQKIKEVILFLFYSVYIRSNEDNLEILEKLFKEIKKKSKKFKSLEVLLAKILILKGERDKAKEILEKLKEKALIEGDKNLLRLIDNFMSSEFD